MQIVIFIGIVIILLVLLYFWLRKPKQKPTTTTTTLPPLPITTTLLPTTTLQLNTSYNLSIPQSALNNGVDDLWIDTQTIDGFVSKVYSLYPDCGLYDPDYCINLCSVFVPTYKYGEHGDHVTIENLVETVTGTCV